MAKISSDERREVAERLRDARRKCESRGYPWMTDDLILALGYRHDYEADNGIFDRLADLIDPITTVELRAPWTICMKCGARMEGYQHKPVRFCPHFGRRIVR